MKKLINSLNSGLNGELLIPGDKSISHRSIMLGSIANGETTIKNFLMSDDCISTINAFKDMGVEIEQNENNIIVHGVGFHGLKKPNKDLDMGNSGTSTRLMMGLLAGQNFDSNLIGDNSLSKRPMKRISTPLEQMGAQIKLNENTLPAIIHGKSLNEIDYTLPIASAQVKSAIILAAIQAKNKSTIKEPIKTRNHTELMLNTFSPNTIITEENTITINPVTQLIGQNINVPGDISSAAFFLVAGAITKNSNITLKNIGINQTRTGILKVLNLMGANYTLLNQNLDGEPTADINIKSSSLKPINLTEQDIPMMIDELPLVGLLAACANGVSKITGAKELRFKETDRIKTLVQEFKKLGISITELEDGFIIDGSKNWNPTDLLLDSHGDHRIGMTMAIAALLIKDSTTLKDSESINISYPTFFNDLNKLIKTS
ncbi:3-phosphoshikimate 1-carboxyvinyltransferase [Lactobacillus sp. S2-2]|uniref:3-phosphoshikimate 1-carboxyvinyltransferase n=1 Tax=Lactobacillus sp. S2-2 TaxID=2692917 RepID=UPI001F022F58|nr:3-phosphoshikimate 1-carboxyvinyltransferase [Lactobacillus sp. S2-2]MCF6514605.1 3-phosphoshikimate 1-carboxyvinyltransferase [Lactobacillus sp. S2-2]